MKNKTNECCKLINSFTIPFAVSKSRNVSRGESLSAEGKAARPANINGIQMIRRMLPHKLEKRRHFL
jgi:hypothetical protein